MTPAGEIPAELRAPVEQALAEARRQLENTGSMAPVFLLLLPGGRTERVVLNDRLAELMNSGSAKEFLFAVVRSCARMQQATAVVVATDAWIGDPTEKQRAMDPAERKRVMTGVRTVADAQALGLVTRREAVMVNVQTPEQVVMVAQFYQRDERARSIQWLERRVNSGPQETFSGRAKMFGGEA